MISSARYLVYAQFSLIMAIVVHPVEFDYVLNPWACIYVNFVEQIELQGVSSSMHRLELKFVLKHPMLVCLFFRTCVNNIRLFIRE